MSNKYKHDNQPKADTDCKLGVHTASNQRNEKKYKFYQNHKNYIFVNYILGLPVYEMTTTAEIHDYTVALNILADTHLFFPITECTFLVNKAVKHICNQVRQFYKDECIIPLNKFEFYLYTFLPLLSTFSLLLFPPSFFLPLLALSLSV